MSDSELEALRHKKLLEMRRQFERKAEKPKLETQETEKVQAVDSKKVLDRFFVDRAWEVLGAAKAQYPQDASRIEKMLVKLISEGKIRGKITGEELYGLFRRLGLRVRLQTRIHIVEHGKVKSLEEKIKEETSQ